MMLVCRPFDVEKCFCGWGACTGSFLGPLRAADTQPNSQFVVLSWELMPQGAFQMQIQRRGRAQTGRLNCSVGAAAVKFVPNKKKKEWKAISRSWCATRKRNFINMDGKNGRNVNARRWVRGRIMTLGVRDAHVSARHISDKSREGDRMIRKRACSRLFRPKLD